MPGASLRSQEPRSPMIALGTGGFIAWPSGASWPVLHGLVVEQGRYPLRGGGSIPAATSAASIASSLSRRARNSVPAK
jgi:hypothetical protein